MTPAIFDEERVRSLKNQLDEVFAHAESGDICAVLIILMNLVDCLAQLERRLETEAAKTRPMPSSPLSGIASPPPDKTP